MKFFAQIVGTATGDSTASVLFFFENKRYLFNCGEGAQRFCTEHKVKLTKIDTVFLTRLHWENIGGIPGMILTVTDVGMAKLRLCGPPNTASFIEATRYFIARNDLTLNVREFRGVRKDDVFQDENVTVVPIVTYADGHLPVTHTPLAEPSEIRGRVACQLEPLPGHDHSYTVHLRTHYNPKKHAMAVENHPAEPTRGEPKPAAQTSAGPKPARRMKQFHKQLPWVEPSQSVVSYAIHTPDIPGKFDAKLADKLGVKPNMRSRLVKGENVFVEETGVTVKPSDCIAPATPGAIFLIVHCPSEAFLQPLITGHQPVWNHYFENAATKAVVHATPRHLLMTAEYQAWMAKFPAATQHIILNEDHCAQQAVFRASAINQNKLHLLDPLVFPRPHYEPAPRCDLHADLQALISSHKLKLAAGQPLDVFHFAPLNMIGLDSSSSMKPIEPDIQSALQTLTDATTNPEFAAAYKTLKEENADVVMTEGNSPGFEIVFLGTGAALPSKYRNVSSTYVSVDGQGGILFDAGEGSYGQLLRRFGHSAIRSVVEGLKCVFISHMHADHHLGLIRILSIRSEIARERSVEDPLQPLLIIGPTAYSFWLREYCEQCQPLADTFTFADSFDFWQNNEDALAPTKQQMEDNLGLTKVEITPVVHCPDAFALALTHKSGWKIVFSGDTRPCNQLTAIGRDCTVLIHEATFEDTLDAEARDKRHSTTTEAIQAALDMNAKFLLMNHFSQRYPKIPVFDSKYNNRTGVAFDLMSVRPEYLHRLPFFLPCLTHMFSEEENEEDEQPTSSAAPKQDELKKSAKGKKAAVGSPEAERAPKRAKTESNAAGAE